MKNKQNTQGQRELSGILSSIRLAAKIIHREINRAGLSQDILGTAGSENVQGEAQMKLDVFANETMKKRYLHVKMLPALHRKKMIILLPLIMSVGEMQNIF